MKLKKKIAALLLAATAVVAAACMTACGNEDPGGNGDAGGNDVGNKSEIIADAAAWKAAFDFSEVTKVTFTLTENIENIGEYNALYKFDGDKVYRKEISSEYDEHYSYEYYYRYSDEVYDQRYPDHGTRYLYYLNEEGNWVLSKGMKVDPFIIEDFIDDNTFPVYDEEADEYVGFGERFADFEYNDQTGRYEATFPELGRITNAVVWLVFRDGKIQESAVSCEVEGEAMESKFTVTDIDTTTVTLPTPTVFEEEEW